MYGVYVYVFHIQTKAHNRFALEFLPARFSSCEGVLALVDPVMDL